MGINFTKQIVKFILTIESSANKWGKLMYGWIGSNYMMIYKTKYIEDLMLIYIFLSIMLHKGREFTINTAKRSFRLIELQPGECLFLFFLESSLFGFLIEVQLYLLNNFCL